MPCARKTFRIMYMLIQMFNIYPDIGQLTCLSLYYMSIEKFKIRYKSKLWDADISQISLTLYIFMVFWISGNILYGCVDDCGHFNLQLFIVFSFYSLLFFHKWDNFNSCNFKQFASFLFIKHHSNITICTKQGLISVK